MLVCHFLLTSPLALIRTLIWPCPLLGHLKLYNSAFKFLINDIDLHSLKHHPGDQKSHRAIQSPYRNIRIQFESVPAINSRIIIAPVVTFHLLVRPPSTKPLCNNVFMFSLNYIGRSSNALCGIDLLLLQR